MAIIEFIRTLDYKSLSPQKVASILFHNGYLSSSNQEYTIAEVEDLIRPLIETDQSYDQSGFGSCGINRDDNP